jgi:hypothetical protein
VKIISKETEIHISKPGKITAVVSGALLGAGSVFPPAGGLGLLIGLGGFINEISLESIRLMNKADKAEQSE